MGGRESLRCPLSLSFLTPQLSSLKSCLCQPVFGRTAHTKNKMSEDSLAHLQRQEDNIKKN
uniref:Uncharacterized protein n=1 Tax=Suricata suricatta TaxID=37032 RepID=A0A673URQ8_SURSU